MNTIPSKMRAVSIIQPGGVENLAIESIDIPKPGASEVLIKVAAAGLNRADIAQRNGHYPPPPGASIVMGLEASGTIVATGKDVTEFKRGDQVCALLTGGGYAEYCTTSAATCLPIPKNTTLVEAASLPETYATVWSNVFDRVALKPNETFLVHGGTSGIGTTAIMLAKAFGAAKVFATAGSDQKCRMCTELGADIAINYKSQDFVEVIKDNTKKGVDVILDMVGGDYIQKNLDCLAPDGRLVNIAYQAGSKAQVNFMPVMLKRLTITGSTLRIREAEFKRAILNSLSQKVWPLIEKGQVKLTIDRTFKMDQVADAHTLMESSEHMGKILLTMHELNER